MIDLARDTTKDLVTIHGWSGVSLGILLYAVLVTGMVAVLAEEIAHWSVGLVEQENPLAPGMDPKATPLQQNIKRLAPQVDPDHLHEVALSRNTVGDLTIFFHKHRTNDEGMIEEVGTEFEIEPATGEVVRRQDGTSLEFFYSDEDRALARFLVSVHTELHLPRPWGLILTGILGLAMMVAAISGLLMHRHIIRDIFTLRRRGNPVLVTKDAHTVAGSWGLPFAFVLAFTGSFFSFAGSIGLPLMAAVGFGGDQEAMFEVMLGTEAPEDPTPAGGFAIDHIIRDAQQRTGQTADFVVIENYGRADASVNLFLPTDDRSLARDNLVYNGVSGEFVKTKPLLGQTESLGAGLFSLMAPLHFGNFLGLVSKAVWFALGFAMCYVTTTGMNMWLERRSEYRFGFLRWCMGVIPFGLPLALLGSAVAFFVTFGSGAASFWTPVGFLVSAAMVLAWAGVERRPRVLNRHFMAATAAGCLLVVVLRLAAGGPGWLEALQAGQEIIVTLDMLLLFAGGALAWMLRDRQTASLAANTTD